MPEGLPIWWKIKFCPRRGLHAYAVQSSIPPKHAAGAGYYATRGEAEDVIARERSRVTKRDRVLHSMFDDVGGRDA